jgi:hypothetical protein
MALPESEVLRQMVPPATQAHLNDVAAKVIVVLTKLAEFRQFFHALPVRRQTLAEHVSHVNQDTDLTNRTALFRRSPNPVGGSNQFGVGVTDIHPRQSLPLVLIDEMAPRQPVINGPRHTADGLVGSRANAGGTLDARRPKTHRRIG